MGKIAVQESKNHGINEFPYSIYHVKMPEHITKFDLHYHNEFELVYVVNGSIEFTILEKKYIANKGDIVLLLPDYPHSMKQVPNVSCEYYCMLFKPEILKRSDSDPIYDRIMTPLIKHTVKLPFILKDKEQITESIKNECNDLMKYWTHSYSSYAFGVLGNLYKIVGSLTEYYEASDTVLLNNKSYDRIKEAIYAVENRYEQPLSIEEMAQLCNVSSSHFMKLFKEATGDSFNNFLIAYRLKMAAKKIAETDDKIVNISTDCGFNNQSYFSRAFTKHFKMSPAEYRNKH